MEKHEHLHHSHGHHHSDKNIKTAFLLNLLFSIIELIGGVITNSISIISDAIHDFGDSISIGIAVLLEKKAKKEPDEKYTFGYLRYSLLGAFITSIILLTGSVIVIFNVLPRLFNPVEVNHDGMLILAVLGLIINGIAAYKTSKSRNLNEKAISLHMLEDVLGWAAVLIGAIVIKFTGWYIIDPILSIFITIYILKHVVENIKEIITVFLEKVPNGLDVCEIKEDLLKIDMLKDVHHIHLWSLDNVNNCASLHVLVDENIDKYNVEELKNKVKNKLKEKNITHTTVEIEYEDCNNRECNNFNE